MKGTAKPPHNSRQRRQGSAISDREATTWTLPSGGRKRTCVQPAQGLISCIRSDTISHVHDKATAGIRCVVRQSERPRARLIRRLEKAERGLLGDVEPVGEGVSEMREFFGPGWRMYYIEQGDVLIVMLGGGSKATQSRDIKRAKELARTLRINEEDQS
ncbi:MAG: type II toxin-antitoxin system RelE/ParE family toxin [Thiohalobacteraceae bacterium]